MARSLTEFLNNFESYRKKYAPKGFAQWLKENGTDQQHALEAAHKKADLTYRKALRTRRVEGERLSDLGLSTSGYADYLRGGAQRERMEQKRSIPALLKQVGEQNAAGYAAYLTDRQEKEGSIAKTIIDNLTRQAVMDYDTAYAYATASGLSAQRAKEAAVTGVNMNKQTKGRELLEMIKEQRPPKAYTIRYAKGAGFSDTEAAMFGDYADEYIHPGTANGAQDRLLDYLARLSELYND